MDKPIVNNRLKWDGSHLGQHNNAIINSFIVDGIRYYKLKIDVGIIYCSAICTKDLFPCIVEDIKEIFNIPRRGIHRITMDNYEYLLYYIPMSITGDLILETPLNRLDSKHYLRKNLKFRRNVQKIIAFCDVLALNNTNEIHIITRPGKNGEIIPINTNDAGTNIIKGKTYDYSIITKTLYLKWFGEETTMTEIIREMVDNKSIITRDNKLAEITCDIRNKINAIIKKYDDNYIWYSCFIIDRMSRHLLVNI